jgi:PAS domain S-box-containing protein
MIETNSQQYNQSHDWQKADARILGQIMAAQNVIFALPDTTRIAEFYAQSLISIPGIVSCRICLENVTIQKGGEDLGICTGCVELRKKATGQPFTSGFNCSLADLPGMHANAINSPQHHFGFFIFQINDPDAFIIYKPFIENLADYVAISLENRSQKNLLQQAQDELERKVEERTEELRASNDAIKDLYNNAPCGYHSLDKDGFFVLINDTELCWLGYTREEIVRKLKFRDLLTENSLKLFEASFPGFTERGWVSDLEFEMIRKDGTILPVLLNATVITDNDGNYVMSRSTIFDITKRKRAEDALNAERGLFVGGPTVVFMWKAQDGWPVEYVSSNVADQFGYAPDELTSGKVQYAAIVHPDDFARVVSEVTSYSEQGVASFEQMYRMARNDGRYRWIQDFTTVIRGRDGTISHYLGYILDITERKQTEENLVKMNERFSLAARAARLGVWDWDIQKDELLWDDGMYELYGVKKEDFAGAYETWLKGIHPDDRASSDEISKQARRGEREYDTEFRVIWPDGSVHYLKAYGKIIRDENGKPLRMTGINIDTTERKRAEQELQVTNDLLSTIIEAVPTAIIGLDMEGKVQLVWNPAAETMLGWSAEEAMGNFLPSVPLEKEDEFRQFREWIQSGKTLNGIEAHREKRDGTPIDYSIYASPLHAPDGQITGNVAVLVDITERKRAENIKQARLRLLEFSGSHSLDELLTATLDEIEVLTGSTIGFYHFVEADQKTLFLQNWSTSTLKNMCTAEGKGSHYGIEQAGVWVDCVHERHAIIHNNYASLPNRKGTPDGHAPIIREVVVPIFRGDLVKAIIGVGNKTTDYNQNDIEIVSQLGDLSWDIAERKRTEEALHQSEERFRRLAENARDVIYRMSIPDGKYEYVSPAALTIFGYSPEESYQNPILIKQAIHPNWHVYFEEQWENLIKGEIPPTYEYQFIHKSGKVRWLNQRNIMVRDNAGNPIAIEGIVTDITDRKLVEEALWKSSQMLKLVLDNMPAYVFWKDRNSVYLGCNRLFAANAGLQPEQLVGLTDMDLPWKQTEAESYRADDQLVMETGIPRLNYEETLLTADGQNMAVRTSKIPLRDPQGAIIGVLGTFEDITERKRAEEALRESEARYRTLFTQAPDAIFLENENDEILDVNPAACKLLGYSRDELLGMRVSDLQSPETRGKRGKVIRGELSRHKNSPFESVDLRRDGSRVMVEISDSRMGDSGLVLSIVRDITERKLAEKELKNAHKQLERLLMFNEDLLSAIPTPVFYKDKDGRYLGCNHAFSEFTGISSEQIKGKTAMELWPGEDAKVYHEKDMELIRNPERQIYEFRVREKNGVEHPVIFAKNVFRDENKQIAGIVGAFMDITERKHAEEEISKLNQELEDRVADRTAQLEAANKELEAFAYSVSHDLRAPLRHINGFLELLQKRNTNTLDAQSQHFMANISDSARRMSTLIDDLLSFSRMGRQEMSKTQVDLGQLIEDVIREFRPETEGRNIMWQIGSLPLVTGDRAMLRVVLVNLISNALKFTQSRSPAEIEVGWMPGHAKEITVFVRDNGAGFDMQYADKLFGVFQRLHRVDEFEGTGIGLANVQRIINRHGGRIWAQGEVDHGATFYFSLPQSHP